MTEPVSVGLVGAGPWAATMHGPVLAAGPETRLTAVWARRSDAAAAVAEPLGATVAGTFDELLDRCEAVAFAVPPPVQAALAVRAARAGKAVLLEKPLALTVVDAEAVAAAVDAAGVVSQLVLSRRYHPRVRAFLAAARTFEAYGARVVYLSGGFRGGPFATPWRLEHGALYDLGPHALDLVEAAVGPIAEIRAAGDTNRWIEVTNVHANGVVSQVSMSGHVGVAGPVSGIALYGPAGELALDFATIDANECWPVVRAEFAAAVRSGQPHELDARRGVQLQHLLARAAGS